MQLWNDARDNRRDNIYVDFTEWQRVAPLERHLAVSSRDLISFYYSIPVGNINQISPSRVGRPPDASWADGTIVVAPYIKRYVAGIHEIDFTGIPMKSKTRDRNFEAVIL